MCTYVIGDIHGCYTQFTELRERIEKQDSKAVFILLGDLISRGPEDEKMLHWAYENITPDGKYQMILGNHDDTFIEVFGCGDFETVYSLGRLAGHNYTPSDEDLMHLKDKELMYQYATFLVKQPLMKEIEVGNQKYRIVHGWYSNGSGEETDDEIKKAYMNRYNLLWKRNRDDYSGDIEQYISVNGEKLIHGHTPTLGQKNTIRRGYSPGKVWDMGSSVNIDCGLVFIVTAAKKRYEGCEYGNLAAYNLETDTVEYLWDIPDGYAENGDEYYEDKKEREEKEHQRKIRQREAAVSRAEPYLTSFYKQVFDTDVSYLEDQQYGRCVFNFLDNYFYNIELNCGELKDYEFDFENQPIFAMTKWIKDKKSKLYYYKKGKWIGLELQDEMKYRTFEYKGGMYLLGVNLYNDLEIEVTVDEFCYYNHYRVLHYKVQDSPQFYYADAEKILDSDSTLGINCRYWGEKEDNQEEPTGLMICNFYADRELLTFKLIKNRGDVFWVRILDSSRNIVTELRQAYYTI